ncbi:MAG: hypothetical protein JJT93_01090 [Gammaproteobacteria bacterium]|nr:hypothetical protein [Gammaproteobacteria bacterium]TVQ47953.1 MAG: hypothetical protein EA371_06860 [Gammaproteobacteria bacterium]
MEQHLDTHEETARELVELGNRLADLSPEADLRDIADGLLAGAVHWWLYAHQPCDDRQCDECGPISTADLRLAELRRLLQEFARSSDYYHTPTDHDVAHA